MVHHRRPSLPDTPPHTPTKFQSTLPTIPATPINPSTTTSHSSALLVPNFSFPLTPPSPSRAPSPKPGVLPLTTADTDPDLPALSLPVPAALVGLGIALPVDEKKEEPSLSHDYFSLPTVSLSLPSALPLLKLTTLTARARRITFLLLSSTIILLVLLFLLLPTSSTSRILSLPSPLTSFHRPTTNPLRHLPPLPFRKYTKKPKILPDPNAPPLVLTPPQELAALISLLSSALDANALPPALDPLTPLDPALVLGFDTRGPPATVQAELSEMVSETWSTNPLVLFTRAYHSPSRALQRLVATYALDPAPLIIEASSRPDAPLLLPLLARLTGSPTDRELDLPLLLVAGKPVHLPHEMHTSGELRSLLLESGMAIGEWDEEEEYDRKRDVKVEVKVRDERRSRQNAKRGHVHWA